MGTVKERLAIYNEDELRLLRCGGLLKWRVKDVTEQKHKLKAENSNQKESNSSLYQTSAIHNFPLSSTSEMRNNLLINQSAHNPNISLHGIPGYIPNIYQHSCVEIPEIRFLPAVQCIPVTYDYNSDYTSVNIQDLNLTDSYNQN